MRSPLPGYDREQRVDRVRMLRPVRTVDFDVVETLRQSPVLRGMAESAVAGLAASATVRHFPRRSLILLDGDPPSFLHIVKNGTVKLFKSAVSGKEFIIDVRCRAETIGMGPVIKGTQHFASAKAMESTDVVLIKRQTFLDFVHDNPAVFVRIADVEFQRIDDLYSRLMDQVSDNADNRLIKTLLSLSAKHGDMLRFTHQEIAEMSGITTETATRIMTRLKRAGVLRSSRGSLLITDRQRLMLQKAAELL